MSPLRPAPAHHHRGHTAQLLMHITTPRCGRLPRFWRERVETGRRALPPALHTSLETTCC